jgi:hypothetical protein
VFEHSLGCHAVAEDNQFLLHSAATAVSWDIVEEIRAGSTDVPVRSRSAKSRKRGHLRGPTDRAPFGRAFWEPRSAAESVPLPRLGSSGAGAITSRNRFILAAFASGRIELGRGACCAVYCSGCSASRYPSLFCSGFFSTRIFWPKQTVVVYRRWSQSICPYTLDRFDLPADAGPFWRDPRSATQGRIRHLQLQPTSARTRGDVRQGRKLNA